MGDTRTGSGVNSPSTPYCMSPSHRNKMCGQRAQTHSLYAPDDYTAFKSNHLDSFCFSGVILHCNSFIYNLFEKSAHSLACFSSLLMPSCLPFLLPLNPFRPLFLPTINGLGSHTLNLLFLSEGGLFINALSFPNSDLSITKLHLHTYCCLTPCAKYSFVKPSPIPCLHLVEIVFFQPQALLSIQAELGWHKHHTAVPLGKLIVKGSGWGFESALCYFYDSCRFFAV